MLLGLLLTGCAFGDQPMDGPDMFRSYQQIDQETAKQMMAQDDGHLVVDVRRLDEYESGHIPGAICIPNESIDAEPPEELPNPNQILLLYCRSGNRSKQAAEKLFRMGYTRVYEFGGIVDWTGEVVTGQTLSLTVKSNPSTGFSWTAAQEWELFTIQSYYVSEPQEDPVSGAGGWQTEPVLRLLSEPWLCGFSLDVSQLRKRHSRGIRGWRAVLEGTAAEAFERCTAFAAAVAGGGRAIELLTALRTFAGRSALSVSALIREAPELDERVGLFAEALRELDRKILFIREVVRDLGEFGEQNLTGADARAYLAAWAEGTTVA